MISFIDEQRQPARRRLSLSQGDPVEHDLARSRSFRADAAPAKRALAPFGQPGDGNIRFGVVKLSNEEREELASR